MHVHHVHCERRSGCTWYYLVLSLADLCKDATDRCNANAGAHRADEPLPGKPGMYLTPEEEEDRRPGDGKHETPLLMVLSDNLQSDAASAHKVSHQ